jgi:hypothetical protein
MTDAKARLLQMIADEPHMGGGGLLKAVGKAQKVAKKAKAATKVIEAPSVIIPGRLSDLKEVVRGKMGNYGAKRVERAADEIPNLERMYREEALRQAFTGDNAKGLMTLNPADFEKYATPLMLREKPLPNSGLKKENLPTDEYVNYLAGINEYHDVPFLEINKQEQGLPLVPFISGHEGRHRNRAMAQRGEQAGLVQLLPRSELREPLPRRSQEEYIQALRDELEMTGNRVKPQTYFDNLEQKDIKRSAIALPDIYAEGGAVHMAGGGRTPKYPWERYPQPKKVTEMRARQITPVAGAVKKAADYATQLIDKGPSFSSLVGNLVGAIPFKGPDFRKRLEASEISIPTDITMPSFSPEYMSEKGTPVYKQAGIEMGKIPAKDLMEAFKMSDFTPFAGLSNVAESIGYGQMPDALDLLDAAGVGALGYGALKGGYKAGSAAAGALTNLAKSDTGYKLAQKALDYVPGAQPMYAVKPKGGNWVDTAVKRQLDRLKNDEDYSPLLVNSSKQDLVEIEKNPSAYLNSAQQIELLRRDIAKMEETNAFNKWVDTKVGGYIRNQMGTPDDPVVKSIDMRVMKAQADLEAGQQRLAALDGRIAEAEKTAVTPEELNQLEGMKRNRSQRAAELQSNYDLTLDTMLPGGKSNEGYGYLRDSNSNPYLTPKRIEAGFPGEGLAQTRLGKAWEAATDANISINPAEMFQNSEAKMAALQAIEDEYKNYQNVELKDKFRDFVNSQPNLKDSTRRALIDGSSTKHMAEMVGDTERQEKLLDDVYQARRKVNNSSSDMANDNPYLAKLAPETPVYMPNGISSIDVDHVIDVLKQDVAAGNIKLEDLNKITMEQALKRMSEYDLDLAKKARDSLGASRAAMPVYKEYPEGYRWVQLTKPGEFRQESEEMGHSVKGYEPPKGHPDWSPTSENSGNESYGHGGWEAIKSGQAKVYSLVDANHKPHVTIEVRQNPADKGFGVNQMPKGNDFYTQNNIYIEGQRSGEISPDLSFAEWWRSTQGIPEPEPPPPIITQIKGKGNARPAAKYDQYTQDFVKSGNWGRVERDLKNTGLIESNGRYFTEPEFAEAAKKYGVMGVQDVPWEVARQRHIDAGIPEDEAFFNWVEGLREGRGRLNIPDEPRMAGGGLLKALTKAQKTAKAVKAAESALKVKPPSDNILNVRQANFQYPKTVGNQTVSIDKLSGGVRMTSASEKQRVNDLANKISSPEGYISRLIVDQNNNVIEGQHRLEALRQLGIKDVPVYKIEELADTMPVSKMESAVKSVGSIHSDHVGQLVSHALEHIAEGGIDSARKMNYGKFQKHYDAALDAAVGMQQTLPAAEREANLAKMLEGSAAKKQLYHGTGRDIKEFDKSKLRRTAFGEGFHLAESPNLANFYANQFDEGQNVMPVHAAIKKPYELKNMHDWYDVPGDSDKDKTNFLKSQGYDGVKYPHGAGGDETSPSPNVYVAFEPTQIKSATGNRGTYDTTDPDINKSEGGEVKSFFEEKSAKQRLLDMIAEEPHMGNGVRPSRLQLQGEIANDTYGGIGGGGRATYTHPVGSDAAIRAYMEGGGYKPKDEPYKGQVNNMGISYEMGFKDGGEVHMGIGGVALNARKVAKAAEATKKAAEAAPYLPGIHYADSLVPPNMRLSEALGNVGAEGKTLNFTETDRSRVFGPNRGGAGFAGLQHYSLPHKEANTVWGFGSKGITEKKVNQNDPENTIWTTYAGSPTQHKSNTVVVKDALGQLQAADKSGLVNPKQIEFINDRIRSAISKKGKPLFPGDFDITDPKAFDFATTFERRAAISDALIGIGVKKPMISREFKAANPGVKWTDAANIEAILKRETDPAMMGANTFDVGPNLFVMDNGIIHRPDLNEAFPYQVTGTDLGMRYELAPFREAAPDWIQARGIKPDEPINAWAMSRAAPSQFVSDKYLTGLQKKGRKEGGLAQIKKVKRHGNTVSN